MVGHIRLSQKLSEVLGKKKMVLVIGLEPTTYALRMRRSTD